MPSILIDVPASGLKLVHPPPTLDSKKIKEQELVTAEKETKGSVGDRDQDQASGNSKGDDSNDGEGPCTCNACRDIRLQHLRQYVNTLTLEQPLMCDRMIQQWRQNSLVVPESHFSIQRSVVLKHARELTSCASCLHSVRTLRLVDHPLLEDDGETLTVRQVHMETIESTAKVLSAYETRGRWMSKVQPLTSKKKKNSIVETSIFENKNIIFII